MTFRHYVKCNVCEKIVIVKVQGGFVPDTNVRFGCPKCNNLIKGRIVQNAPYFDMKFENAKEVIDDLSGNTKVYTISTELPILKSLSNTNNPTGFSINPYLAVVSGELMSHDQLTIFRESFLTYLKFREDNLGNLEVLIELFLNEKWEYFLKEAKNKFLSELIIEDNNNLQYCIQVASDIVRLFISKIVPGRYEHSYLFKLLYKETLSKVQEKKSNLTSIYSDVSKYLDIEREFGTSLQLALFFIKNIESYLPVIGLSYGKGFDEVFGEDLSITTFSFDELKDNYKDTFELIARISLLYVAISNFNRNSSVDDFSDIGICNNLEGYYKLNNGNKKIVFEKIPRISKYFRGLLNSQIRNSIGHNKTKYFTVEQVVRYYPYTDVKKKDKFKELSLIDFAYQSYLLNLFVIDFIYFSGKLNGKLNS